MSGHDRSFLLIPLLLALIPISLSPLQPKDASNRTLNLTLAPVRNYIARFLDYKISGDHRSYLEENLRSVANWQRIERKNPAAALPTDFGLLETADSNRADVIGEIERLEGVKDVYAGSSYSRSLFVDEGSEKNGSFFDEKKRPGKIFTSMSIEEGEGSCSPFINATFSWKRKILMQRSQVASLFEADRLWKKGFTGAEVKMAIFDTGIQANHPHFRNIKRTNWTNEDTLNDNLGHGTFVAGVIAGEDEECLGLAPDTEIYAFEYLLMLRYGRVKPGVAAYGREWCKVTKIIVTMRYQM